MSSRAKNCGAVLASRSASSRRLASLSSTFVRNTNIDNQKINGHEAKDCL